MRILIRKMFPCPPLPRWREFEAMLVDCLTELGHDITLLDLDPVFPPDPPGCDFFIYCHKTRREVPHGDLFYKEMHMQGLFTIDDEGWGPEHSAVRTVPDLSRVDAVEAHAMCLEMRSEFLSSGRSKHNQPPIRPIDSSWKPYYLAPLQLPTDDVIMYHSPLSVIEYVHVLSDWAEDTGRNVVFKLHPGSPFPDIAAVVEQRTGKHVFLANENIHSLVTESNGVIVLNSGVGFESLIHGKPVTTLGACDYQWVTFRATPSHLNEAANYMESYTEAQQTCGYQFIYFYYHEHAYQVWPQAAPDARSRLFAYLRKRMPAEAARIQRSSGGHGA